MQVNLIEPAYAEAQATAYHAEGVRSESATGVYEKIVHWALRIGVFLAPIFFLPWTTGILELNKQVLLMAVAGTGLVAWLLSLVSSGKLSWRSTYFDKGVLAVLGAVIIATVFSLSKFNSLFGIPTNLSSSLISILSLTVIYFLITQTTEDGGQELAKILGVSLVITLIYGLLQLLGVHLARFPFAVSRAFNTVGSADALGVVAAISLPLLSARIVTNWVRYVFMAGFVAALAILVILNWWVLWTVAIVGMVGLIAAGSLATRESGAKFSISRFVLPMTVIVIGVFLSVVNFNLAAIKTQLPIEVSPSFSLSGNIVQSVLKDSLVTGYGPETFSLAFDKYGAKQLSDSTLSNAKFFAPTSEAMNFVVENGILGLLALVVLAWSFVQALRYAIRSHRFTGNILGNAVWAMLLAIIAATLLYPFGTTLMFLAYTVLGLVVLAVWGSHRKTYNVEDNVYLSLASSLGFIGGLILALVGVYFGASVYVADVNYAKALAQTDVNKAAENLVSAVNWNGKSDAYYRGASQVALGLLSQELNKPANNADTQRAARIQNYMSSSISLARTATELGPREALNWDNLGIVYQNLLGLVDGVDQLSEAAYMKASELRPGDASYYNKIGNLYLTKANILRQVARNNQNASQINQQITQSLASAEASYKKAIELSQNFGLAIYNLGVVYDQQGKLSDAIRQLERIAPFNNDQPNLLFELGLLYYRNGEKDKAFETMRNVLVLSPDFANAHWYLALIYEERRDIANAIAEIERILAVEANKDNEAVLAKLEQLKSGQPAPATGINQQPIQ